MVLNHLWGNDENIQQEIEDQLKSKNPIAFNHFLGEKAEMAIEKLGSTLPSSSLPLTKEKVIATNPEKMVHLYNLLLRVGKTNVEAMSIKQKFDNADSTENWSDMNKNQDQYIHYLENLLLSKELTIGGGVKNDQVRIDALLHIHRALSEYFLKDPIAVEKFEKQFQSHIEREMANDKDGSFREYLEANEKKAEEKQMEILQQ